MVKDNVSLVTFPNPMVTSGFAPVEMLGKSMAKKKDFKWEVRQTDTRRWGIFLQQQFCRTDEPVCYAVSRTRESAQQTVGWMNDPDYWHEED